MSRVSVVRELDGYVLRLTAPQRGLMESVLLFMRDRPEPESVLRVWVGCGRERLSQLYEGVRGRVSSVFSIEDLHSLLAALVVTPTLFSSEEDFYTRIGFFKENVSTTADGLVRAITDVESKS
jgi:hypothetical protein